MKFSKKDSVKFEWPGITGWPLSSSDDFEGASTAYFEVTGSHGRVKSKLSDRIYYVLEGTGEFDIDGKLETVAAGNSVIVPKNTPYDYRATSEMLKLFMVHTPAYSADDEVHLS